MIQSWRKTGIGGSNESDPVAAQGQTYRSEACDGAACRNRTDYLFVGGRSLIPRLCSCLTPLTCGLSSRVFLRPPSTARNRDLNRGSRTGISAPLRFLPILPPQGPHGTSRALEQHNVDTTIARSAKGTSNFGVLNRCGDRPGSPTPRERSYQAANPRHERAGNPYFSMKPASTGTVVPVIHRASSEHKKLTTADTSCMGSESTGIRLKRMALPSSSCSSSQAGK